MSWAKVRPRRGARAGGRVVLAPLQRKDSATLFRWINDRNLVVFNAAFRPVHTTQHHEWLAAVTTRKDTLIFAIRLRRGDRLIGTCQLHSIDPVHGSAELQIRIGDAKARGKGYGLEAVQLLVDFGFRDLNLHRVWLHVFGTNTRALRTYEKAGFQREGVMREGAFVDGRFVDVVVMGMLNHE